MTDQLVGIGRVYVKMNIDGMTPDDWSHIEEVVPVLQQPDGQKIESTEAVEINKSEGLIRFIHEFKAEGVYIIGVRIVFDDGLWSTSYRNDAVRVTDAFSIGSRA